MSIESYRKSRKKFLRDSLVVAACTIAGSQLAINDYLGFPPLETSVDRKINGLNYHIVFSSGTSIPRSQVIHNLIFVEAGHGIAISNDAVATTNQILRNPNHSQYYVIYETLARGGTVVYLDLPLDQANTLLKRWLLEQPLIYHQPLLPL